jgi:hypothetical protein
MVKREEFENLFLPFNERGKQIRVIVRVKELPLPIVKIALNLAALEFINFVNISDEALAASSENYPNRPKVPVTKVDHQTAIGIEILYSESHEYINFFGINSPIKGKGTEMVDAVFKDFPKKWQATVVFDTSGGFWDKMKEKYKNKEWML